MDDDTDYMALLGLEQDEPEHIAMDRLPTRVPTRDLTPEDFRVYQPFAEGSVTSDLDFQLRFLRRLLRGQPFSLTDPLLEEMAGTELFGAYAFYYQGPHPAYAELLSCASDNPLYGGASHRTANRILGHRDSLAKSDLLVSDFTVRFLILSPVWRHFVEDTIHEMFYPMWVKVLRGLGTPGTGTADINEKRSTQKRSDWDSFHNMSRRSGASTNSTKWELKLKVLRAVPDCLRAYRETMKLLKGEQAPVSRPKPVFLSR
jgi:Eco29kI restriction endonuclease